VRDKIATGVTTKKGVESRTKGGLGGSLQGLSKKIINGA